MKLIAGVCAAIASAICTPVGASDSPIYPVLRDIQQISPFTTPGGALTYEMVVARLSDPIRFDDLDGNGLDKNDLATVDLARQAIKRGQNAGRLLQFDLNNDQTVTRSEIDEAFRLGLQYGVDKRDAMLFLGLADSNADGSVTWQEMMVLPATPDAQRSQADRLAMEEIALDPTPATPFTLADAKTVADELFTAYDQDRNGILDRQEQSPAIASQVLPR